MLVSLYNHSPGHLSFVFPNRHSGSGTRAATVSPGSRMKQG